MSDFSQGYKTARNDMKAVLKHYIENYGPCARQKELLGLLAEEIDCLGEEWKVLRKNET